MKQKIISCITGLIFTINIQAQTERGYEISLEYNKLFDVKFTIYSEQNQVVKKINSQSMANLSSPEGLIQSHFSATNKKWVESNFLEPEIDKDSREQKHFDFVKRMDSNKNFVKLIDKYSFNENGMAVSLVLYLINYEGEKFKFPTVLSMIKKGERWYIYNLPNKYDLTMVLLQMKPDKFQELLLGLQTGNQLTDSLIKLTRNAENGLDIIKLQAELVKFNTEKNSEALKYFINQ